MMWFDLKTPEEKIARLPEALASAMALTRPAHIFDVGRDVAVLPIHELPAKIGLGQPRGTARLLHDLANIELQAMELAVRTLFEFPEAPPDFRAQLAEIAISESQHLGFCLTGLEMQRAKWGDWPVHLALWNTVSKDDSLLDRILIVHRYLEGSGLDAGDSILKRLMGVADKSTRDIVRVIVEDEVGHVEFGSRWYRKVAAATGVDPEIDFPKRIHEIALTAPRREKIAHDLRRRAGFTEKELALLDQLHLDHSRGYAKS